MASEPMSLNDLPDEILLKILSYFEITDLCLIIAKVCEKWNALAKYIILWKKLPYICYGFLDFSDIEEVLTAAPALYSLIIREHEYVADILELLFHKHCDLKKLTLENCYLGEDSTGLLTNIVDFFPDLEGLSLKGCRQITSAGYCLIPRLKKLSELNLSSCEGLSGKTVRLIAEGCQHLKKLILDDVLQFFDDDVLHVIEKLGQQLTTLVLDGECLTDVAYLYLNNCGSVTAQGWSTFFHRSSMISIVLLTLAGCSNLDDEGLKGIAKRCINVEELNICWCSNVTDAGISMVISHCNQLRVLELEDLDFITGGCLALVPSHLPHLRELSLESCKNVCVKYVKELVAAVPDLTVIAPHLLRNQ